MVENDAVVVEVLLEIMGMDVKWRRQQGKMQRKIKSTFCMCQIY
jgi:hypothetical protein